MSADRQPSDKAALRGEPSYVWRAGQERRLRMVQNAAGPERLAGRILEDGSGVGSYLYRLAQDAGLAVGLEIDFERAADSMRDFDPPLRVVQGAGEYLPFPDNHFDLILSHEVIEHMDDDKLGVREMVRVLRPGGRITLFCPNRGYPFETHGIYRRGEYQFGNKLFVNYLPRKWRDRLAPHVNVYSGGDLTRLFEGLPVKFIQRRVIFGAYDNIIARYPFAGRVLRLVLQKLESTPLQWFGLSHFWVVEKTG